MKKLLTPFAILLSVILLYNIAEAQNDKRYNIEMSFNYNGKTIKSELSSASYSLSKDQYQNSSEKKSIYVSVIPIKLEKDLLLAYKDTNAKFDITITVTDAFGKTPKRETLLKKAIISNLSESSSPYNYEYSSSVSVSLLAESIVIEGVEILP
ncbi:MAG: hypothetical protein ACK5NK_15915 [Niabella sp.]